MRIVIFVSVFIALPIIGLAQSYPTATGGNSGWEYISNVQLANINNTSTGSDADNDGDNAYDAFDDLIIYVNRGRTYDLSVSISPDSRDYVYAWIDWDNDMTFESTEQIILAQNVSTTGPFTKSITVPTNAATGLTRMRVVLKWNGTPTATGSQSYGEVEDYWVNVSAYNYIYLGGWDANGLPDYLEPVRDNVTAETMDLINNVLPDGQPNLEYIDYNDYLNVSVDTGTRIWASYIYEGAGWQNTFAMYQYPTGNAPVTESDIDSLTIIFPNSSASGSGGSLTAGDKVYYDSVSEGTTVAFAIIAQGWSLAKTETTIDNQGAYIHYSNNNLNIEPVDSLKAHNVTFWDPTEEKYILGYEDTRRDNSGCDHDFNDVLFYITLDPIPIFDEGGGEQQPPDITNPDDNGLPVEWLGFEARKTASSVLLYWFVASQINNDYFVIERSLDMANWQSIGEVKGHGTTQQLMRYSFEDYDAPIGRSYYRIQQRDYDGSKDYSETISIQNTEEQNLFMAVYPNPVQNGEVNLRVEGIIGDVCFKVIDSKGKLVHMENFNAIGNFNKRFDAQMLEDGLYLIEINNGDARIQRKVIIQR